MLLDKPFKKSTVGKFFSDTLAKLVDLKNAEWVTTMHSIGNHARDVHQSSILLSLLSLHFNLMKCLVEAVFVDAFFDNFCQGVPECLLTIGDLLFIDSLHAERKGSLTRRVVEASAGTEVRRDTFFDNRLVEGSVGSLQQDIREYLHAESLVGIILRIKVTKVSKAKLCLLVSCLHKIGLELLFLEEG